MTIELNKENYEREVLQSKGFVLVDFWGPQCRPCMALMPVLEELEQQYKERLKIGKVNAAENRMLCAKLRVLGLPTFILYKDGKEIKRLTGEHVTKNDLTETITSQLG